MPKKMLSKNFSEEEMACEDNCGIEKNTKMSIVILLELIRERFGNQYNTQCMVSINDGCRCYNQNEITQEKWYPINNNGRQYKFGNSKSTHMDLYAADIKVKIRVPVNLNSTTAHFGWEQLPSREVYDYLDELFPESLGLGLYNNPDRIHIDCRKKKVRW